MVDVDVVVVFDDNVVVLKSLKVLTSYPDFEARNLWFTYSDCLNIWISFMIQYPDTRYPDFLYDLESGHLVSRKKYGYRSI